VHDWGAALGFDRACCYPERIAGIVYMEAMVRPRLWSDLPPGREPMFRALRGPEGEKIVLQDNFFVEKMLFDFGIIRRLSRKREGLLSHTVCRARRIALADANLATRNRVRGRT
jgi:haloalkane dehalogenase